MKAVTDCCGFNLPGHHIERTERAKLRAKLEQQEARGQARENGAKAAAAAGEQGEEGLGQKSARDEGASSRRLKLYVVVKRHP